ncbi:MAG TPA: helix-turn-helix domain-containing protein [Euzebyales bacterium]|nr:helix-turn-helix domain-containing protein [Euzebyales bacterium]
MGEQVAQHVIGVPAPALRPFVSRYTGYRYEGFDPGVHVGLPSRDLTFAVSLGDPIEVGELRGPDGARNRFPALASGLHAVPVAVHHDGNQHGLQLALTPLGCRALFGMPAAEMASLTVPLDSLLGALAVELVDRVRSAAVWSQRFAVLDRVLLRAFTEPVAPAPEITLAWERLTRTGGGVGVARLADEVGWSRRHLSERFRREYGLPPKTMARIVRFERARRMVTATGGASLGTIAATAGYADQAHMTREWHDFAGGSPLAWMSAERLPFVQDGGEDDRSDSPA